MSNNHDRFIPLRENSNLFNYKISKNNLDSIKNNKISEPYNKYINENLFLSKNELNSNERIIKYKENNKAENIFKNLSKNLKNINNENQDFYKELKNDPYKILEAPNLKDDFYNNLIDWSSNNMISVGWDNTLFLWNYYNENITKIKDYKVDDICGLKFSQQGKVIAVGLSNGKCELYDCETEQRILKFYNHYNKVGVFSWYKNLLVTGSKDNTIIYQDIREKIKNKNFKNNYNTLKGHTEEICSLKFSQNGSFLASGGNDNIIYIWSLKKNKFYSKLTGHTGAVKALDWSPMNNNLLLSGGGSKDKYFNKINKILGL